MITSSSESFGLRSIGDVHGDDQGREQSCPGPEQAEEQRQETAGCNGDGGVECEYGLRHDPGYSGNPGTATCTTSGLPVGTDTITGTYSGDSNHGGSAGTLSGGQVVKQASVNDRR